MRIGIIITVAIVAALYVLVNYSAVVVTGAPGAMW